MAPPQTLHLVKFNPGTRKNEAVVLHTATKTGREFIAALEEGRLAPDRAALFLNELYFEAQVSTANEFRRLLARMLTHDMTSPFYRDDVEVLWHVVKAECPSLTARATNKVMGFSHGLGTITQLEDVSGLLDRTGITLVYKTA